MASHSSNGRGAYSLNEQDPYWVLQELPRREARAQFDRTMASKSERIRQLRSLLESFGISLDGDFKSVQAMNDWFIDSITPLPGRDVPDGASLSVCEDVALYLGDVMISRHPGLRWDFFTWGKNNGSYQCHVIMGFPFDDPALHTNLDLGGIVHAYGVQVLKNRLGTSARLDLPEDHPLAGLVLEPPRLSESKFVDLLEKVDARFKPKG